MTRTFQILGKIAYWGGIAFVVYLLLCIAVRILFMP